MKPYWIACEDVLLCPAAKRPVVDQEYDGVDDRVVGVRGSTFRAWVELYFDRPVNTLSTVTCSYGLNLWLSDMRPIDGAAMEGWGWQTCRVKGAGDVPVLCDCTIASSHTGAQPYTEGSWDEEEEWRRGPWIERHDDGINVLLMDWSVEKFGLKELPTLKWHREWNGAAP